MSPMLQKEALVLLGRPPCAVVSPPLVKISEPITGGSAIISGNFTLEDANNVAMLVRSGALPGRLNVVDQQVVEPVATAGKQ